ncbi:U6 snRNA m6A methyltransferase, partial [Tremellales sp. Uapishka_1]
MHPLNPYLDNRPDFARLASRYPSFAPFLKTSSKGYASIDFQDAKALRKLTRCLLKEDFGLDVDLRIDRLCPTLANRLDYLLHLLDLEPFLHSESGPLRVIDIGTGASVIYPLLLRHLRPSSQAIATELDDVSYRHALTVLETNAIPATSIEVRLATAAGKIIFPLFDDPMYKCTFTLCNPPFFSSMEEMAAGQDIKLDAAHAAPTAATNELITPGGEVAFVRRMIEESMQVQQRCLWYTSLLGRYASLEPLVEEIRRRKINNYFVKSIQQARTTRWIIAWSHTSLRLPDGITRPVDLIRNTSFARLLPLSNIWVYICIASSASLADTRICAAATLKAIGLISNDRQANENELILAPKTNTWSRAARRLAKRGQPEPDDPSSPPLMKLCLRFLERNGEGRMELQWLEGRDRNLADGFWKFLLSQIGSKRKREREPDEAERHGKRTNTETVAKGVASST